MTLVWLGQSSARTARVQPASFLEARECSCCPGRWYDWSGVRSSGARPPVQEFVLLPLYDREGNGVQERETEREREREREILRVASSVAPVFVSLPGPVVATLLRDRVYLTVRSVEWDMRRNLDAVRHAPTLCPTPL